MTNIPSPEHSTCQKCRLFEGCRSPFMSPGNIQNGSDILIVGEAPGEEEDLQGRAFVGKSGQELRRVLRALDMNPDNVVYTNAVRCRPPDNKISKKYINYCKQFLLDEIEELDPEYVLLMGNSPLEAVLNQSGITTWNGVVVEENNRVYIPMFHPAYILRNPEILDEWLEGFVKLSDMLEGILEDEVEYEYNYPKTVVEIRTMADELRESDIISYDLETTSLDPFSDNQEIIVMSFAKRGKSWAFPLDHNETWFDGMDLNNIEVIVRNLLKEHPGIVGHNIKFDLQHSMRYDIKFETFGDTMLISHLLDSRRGIHSLKRLAGLHLGMYKYDDELEEYKRTNKEADPGRGGNYGNIPLNVLLPYSCMDTHATLELYYKLYPRLSKKQQYFHDEVLCRVSTVIAEMEYNGIHIDKHIAERYYLIYGTIQRRLYDKFIQDERIKKTVKLLQKTYDRKLMEDKIDAKADGRYITHVLKSGKVSTIQRDIIEFNPNSSAHLRVLYFNVCGIPTTEVGKTDTGKPSTELIGMKKFADKIPIVGDIIYYRLLSNMISKYLRPAAFDEWQSDDGVVRSNFNLHGTRTGRLSSSDPNLQNIPTPEKEPGTLLEWLPLKNIFTASEGNDLVSVDYSGMELRVFASLANCEPMLEIHRSGMDFHSMVGILVSEKKSLYSITPEEVKYFKEYKKAIRYRYKWTNWTLLYGGDYWTLYSMYPDDFPTVELAEETQKAYFDAFPEVPLYMDTCVDFVSKNGYIESPFGRREYLPYLANGSQDKGMVSKDRRSAVNMPVQSAASDILLCALIVISKRIKEAGLKSMLVNTVHDSIVLDCPKGETKQVIDICVYVMENIKEIAKTEFPDIDFQWLKSPLNADADFGSHYGVLLEYEK